MPRLPNQTLERGLLMTPIIFPKSALFAGLRWAVRPFPTEEGTLVLCGALQIAGTQGGLTAKVPRALAFTVDGKRVVRGLQWMPIVSTRNDLDGSTVKCRAYNKVKLPEQFQYGLTVMQRRISG